MTYSANHSVMYSRVCEDIKKKRITIVNMCSAVRLVVVDSTIMMTTMH